MDLTDSRPGPPVQAGVRVDFPCEAWKCMDGSLLMRCHVGTTWRYEYSRSLYEFCLKRLRTRCRSLAEYKKDPQAWMANVPTFLP